MTRWSKVRKDYTFKQNLKAKPDEEYQYYDPVYGKVINQKSIEDIGSRIQETQWFGTYPQEKVKRLKVDENDKSLSSGSPLWSNPDNPEEEKYLTIKQKIEFL